MCRIAAAVGTERPLASLLYEPDHSLEVQSYRPAGMVSGTVNVDGAGIAWWTDDRPQPLRYVTERPLWSEPNLPNLAHGLAGSTMLAAVRSATPRVGYGIDHVQPFVFGSTAIAHNGWIGGWGGPITTELLGRIGPDLIPDLRALNDSRVLALLIAGRRVDGRTLAEAVSQTIDDVTDLVVDLDESASLTVVAAERGHIVARRAAVGVASNGIWVDPVSCRLASEPLDGADWIELSDGDLAEIDPDRVSIGGDDANVR